MNIEKIGKSLIALGVLLILFSLSMPVAKRDSEVVNLHLMNQKQNTLILGGLLFVSGIVLFATFKIKQTEQEARAKDEAMEALKQKTSERIAEGRSAAKNVFERIWGERGEPVVAKQDHPIARVITGLYFGIIITALIMVVLPEGMTGYGMIGFPISLWLVFRPIPASALLSRIYVVNTAIFLALPIGYIADLFLTPDRRHGFGEGLALIIPAAVTCVMAVYIRKK